jgi:hypothetical protein
MEDHQSVERWRRESRLAIERSRERRTQGSPHPWPPTAAGWAGALLAAVVIALVCYGFLVFFGVEAWS